MRILIIALALFLPALPALPAMAELRLNEQQALRFYATASVGADIYDINYEQETALLDSDILRTSDKIDIDGESDAHGALRLGAEWHTQLVNPNLFDGFFIGAELVAMFRDFSAIKKTQTIEDNDLRIDYTASAEDLFVGGNLTAGLTGRTVLGKYDVYGFMGGFANDNKVKITITDTQETDPQDPFTLNINKSAGFQTGFGARHSLSQTVPIYVDFRYTYAVWDDAKKKQKAGKNKVVTLTHVIEPTSHFFDIGLTLRF